MTVKEAILMSERIVDENVDCGKQHLTDNAITAIEMGIKALERNIPVMAKTKVMPNMYDLEELEVDYCPACNNEVKFGDFFCSKCGQAIKFTEWNENEIDRR